MRKTISAIVPVYNEEKTLTGVIEALLESHLLDEVICINDGSTDSSLAILKKFEDRIQLIDLNKNYGKGAALVQGIKRAQGEIVAFFDADFTNLSQEHIKALLNPIIENKARAVLGYPTRKRSLPTMFQMFARLTGERAYYKEDLIPHIERMAESRFGVETFLNNAFEEKQTKTLSLKGLVGLFKYEKHSPSVAFEEYLKEAVEIAREIGRREGLLPEDYKIIDKLTETANFKELKAKVSEIKNEKLKQFLERYVLKYIKKAQSWWKNNV